MTWFRGDDESTFHPKILVAENEACGAFWRVGCWCAKHLTDGKFPRAVALTIAPWRIWQRLISSGLVEQLEADELQIHDYLDYNPSAEEVIAEREKRSEAGRLGGIKSGLERRRKREAKPKQVLRENGSKSEASASAGALAGAQANAEAHAQAKTNPSPQSPDPVGSPEQAPTNQLAPVGETPRPAAPDAGSGHRVVVECYFVEFEKARGSKPIFGSREGKAIRDLLEKMGGAEAAQAAIRRAYADQFTRSSATILTIAADPSKFIGPPRTGQTRLPIVQPVAKPGEYDWRANAAKVIE